ncbi:hypothetical protein MASR1M59_03980 [Melaminivora sp.]
MPLNVEQAELVDSDGRPALRLVIDGATAWIYEPKRSLLELGYAVLVDDAQAPAHWAERLPPLQIPEDEDSGRGALELRAATQDALVVGLARSFWNLCNGHGEFTPRRIDLALARARLAAR